MVNALDSKASSCKKAFIHQLFTWIDLTRFHHFQIYILSLLWFLSPRYPHSGFYIHLCPSVRPASNLNFNTNFQNKLKVNTRNLESKCRKILLEFLELEFHSYVTSSFLLRFPYPICNYQSRAPGEFEVRGPYFRYAIMFLPIFDQLSTLKLAFWLY